MTFLIQFIIALIMAVISYLISPKPKTPTPDAVSDLENPTAEAGVPVTVIFGTITMKSPNCLWYGEKKTKTYKVAA